MKVLKIILIILVSLFALIVLVGLLLPSKVSMERKITIDAPASVVYGILNDMHNFHLWSPWTSMDSNMKYKVSGPAGVGSTYEWDSKVSDLGKGKMKIIKSEPNKYIQVQLNFGDEGNDYSPFKLTEENGKTTVVWGFDANLGNSPFFKYFGLFMESMAGPQYDKGLKSLKVMAEKIHKMISGIPITIEQFPGQKLYSVLDSCKMEMNEISAAYTKAFKEIAEFCGKNKIQCTGAPLSLMNSYTNIYSFEASFPVVDNKSKLEGRIIASAIPACKVVKAVYTGPYNNMIPAYDKIIAYIKDNKLEINGRSWEQYISDPNSTPEDKLITHIYFPVK
ncbi:MAG: hypothetical protein EPN82_02790 [Bacteroidetes bacterium]|nr:MAG: hypothetical protein EPN82_02790 [Bacteroidota bacterium]